MNWDTVQQLIRIIAFAGGGMLFGQDVANGEMFGQAVGGVTAIGAFAWWWFWERKRA